MSEERQFNGVIYSSFSDVPEELLAKGYSEGKFIEHFISKCKYYSEKTLQDDCITKLPLLINLLSYLKNSVNVLDYGGGLGQVFFGVEKFLLFPEKLNWHVVDVEGVIGAARNGIKDQRGLFFHNDTDGLKDIDILLFRQSLQIIRDYKQLIEYISYILKPVIIYISGIAAGKNEEYITLVLLEGDKGLPCYIFNEESLVAFVKSLGYLLLERYTENIEVNLSIFSDDKYHLDGKKKNYVKGYIFLRKGVLGNERLEVKT